MHDRSWFQSLNLAQRDTLMASLALACLLRQGAFSASTKREPSSPIGARWPVRPRRAAASVTPSRVFAQPSCAKDAASSFAEHFARPSHIEVRPAAPAGSWGDPPLKMRRRENGSPFFCMKDISAPPMELKRESARHGRSPTVSGGSLPGSWSGVDGPDHSAPGCARGRASSTIGETGRALQEE
jgi:hypothetical protein